MTPQAPVKKCRFCAPLLLAACVLLYALAVAGYAVWSYHTNKTKLLADIDHNLLQAARTLKYLLAPDFHDRALAPDSIGRDEELRNRKLITDFGVESGFKWVQTIVENDGRFYFSAPSVSEEEARERESWYFYPYEDIPEEFVQGFRDNQPVFLEFTDQWGTYRSVALPETSPGGRRYIAEADRDISEIHRLLRRDLIQSVSTALFFLLASVPFIVFLSYLYRTHTAELLDHQAHLEEQVQERTAALQQETRQLQEALANVRTLRGLLPICASCKKIRDDKGYWNQLELYIQQNSDAEFTHGICPECIRKLYPEFAEAIVPPPPAPNAPDDKSPPA